MVIMRSLRCEWGTRQCFEWVYAGLISGVLLLGTGACCWTDVCRFQSRYLWRAPLSGRSMRTQVLSCSLITTDSLWSLGVLVVSLNEKREFDFYSQGSSFRFVVGLWHGIDLEQRTFRRAIFLESWMGLSPFLPPPPSIRAWHERSPGSTLCIWPLLKN